VCRVREKAVCRVREKAVCRVREKAVCRVREKAVCRVRETAGVGRWCGCLRRCSSRASLRIRYATLQRERYTPPAAVWL